MRHVMFVLLCLAATAHADDLEARARKLSHDAIIVDGHLDAPDQLSDKWADISTRGATPQFDLPRAKEGGLTAPFFSIFVSPAFADAGGTRRAVQELLKRGHTDAEVKKILGENFLAFFGRVEAAKKSLATEPPSTAVFKQEKK